MHLGCILVPAIPIRHYNAANDVRFIRFVNQFRSIGTKEMNFAFIYYPGRFWILILRDFTYATVWDILIRAQRGNYAVTINVEFLPRKRKIRAEGLVCLHVEVKSRRIYDTILARYIDFYGIRNSGRANDATSLEGGRINGDLGSRRVPLRVSVRMASSVRPRGVSSVVSIRLDGLVY